MQQIGWTDWFFMKETEEEILAFCPVVGRLVLYVVSSQHMLCLTLLLHFCLHDSFKPPFPVLKPAALVELCSVVFQCCFYPITIIFSWHYTKDVGKASRIISSSHIVQKQGRSDYTPEDCFIKYTE